MDLKIGDIQETQTLFPRKTFRVLPAVFEQPAGGI